MPDFQVAKIYFSQYDGQHKDPRWMKVPKTLAYKVSLAKTKPDKPLKVGDDSPQMNALEDNNAEQRDRFLWLIRQKRTGQISNTNILVKYIIYKYMIITYLKDGIFLVPTNSMFYLLNFFRSKPDKK